jgi:hypothetical protein
MNPERQDLLDKIEEAAGNGLTVPQVVVELGLDYNQFISQWMSDTELRQAYDRGVLTVVKEMVDIMSTNARAPGKQQLLAAKELLRYYQGLHQVVTRANETPAQSNLITVNPEVITAIENYQDRKDAK